MKIYLLIFLLILISKFYCQDWQFVGLDSLMVKQLYITGDTIYAGTDNRINKEKESGLFRSTDDGKSWIKLDSALGNGPILGFVRTKNNIMYINKGNLASAIAGRLYKTTNEGSTWEKLIVSEYGIKWFNVSPFDNEKIYAVDYTLDFNSVYKSLDGGNTWEFISPFPSSSHGRFITFNLSQSRDSVLFAFLDIAFSQLFLKSTDDGYSWESLNSPYFIAREIITDNEFGCRVYSQSSYTTDISNDCGLNWTQTFFDSTLTSRYLSFYFNCCSPKLYMLRTTGIYVSDKLNVNWEKINGTENLPLKYESQPGFQPEDIGQLMNIIFTNDLKTIYVGTLSGIYKKSNITNVSIPHSEIKDYMLYQNYPNPFNSRTKIKYFLQEASLVIIKVYNVLGKEVAILINKEQSEGNYEVEFNASDLPSGTYIYELRVNDYSSYKKLMVLK